MGERPFLKIIFLTALFFNMPSWAQSQKTLSVGVATQSAVKIEAVKGALSEIFKDVRIQVHAFKASSRVAEQPVGAEWGLAGALNRIQNAKAQAGGVWIDYWIAMENFIAPTEDQEVWFDQAVIVVLVTHPHMQLIEHSVAVNFSHTFATEARQRSTLIEPSGYSTTSGEVIRDHYFAKGIDLPKDDWHQHMDFGGVSRSILLKQAIANALRRATVGPKASPCVNDLTDDSEG